MSSSSSTTSSVINLDHIGSPEVCPAVIQYLSSSSLLVGNPNALHTKGNTAKKRYHTAEKSVLQRFSHMGFDNVEIIPGGGTLANKRAILGAVKYFPSRSKPKDVVVMSQLEHPSINNYIARELQNRGYLVIKVASTASGVIDINAYNEVLGEYGNRIALVSVVFVNNEIGMIQPIHELYRRAKEVNKFIVFHSDVCHGLPMVIDKNSQSNMFSADIVSFSAYKIGGLHTGVVLYKKESVYMSVDYFGTPDVCAAEATALALEDMTNRAHVKSHIDVADCSSERLERDEVVDLPHFKNSMMSSLEKIFESNEISYKVVSIPGESIVNVISYVLAGVKGSLMQQLLCEQHNILIGTGAACTSSRDGSHTLKYMGFEGKLTFNLIRLSFTENEIPHKDVIITAFDTVTRLLNGILNGRSNSRSIPIKEKLIQTVTLEPAVTWSLYNKESKVSVDLINGNENREDIADDMISVPDVNEAEFKYNKIRVSIADAYLKGCQKNRYMQQLIHDIKKRISNSKIVVKMEGNSLYIGDDADNLGETNAFIGGNVEYLQKSVYGNGLDMLRLTPGIAHFSPCYIIERRTMKKDAVDEERNIDGNSELIPVLSHLKAIVKEALQKHAKSENPEKTLSFRIETKLKGPNNFCGKSKTNCNIFFGSYCLDNFPLTVNLNSPDLILHIDIFYTVIDIYTIKIKGIGGLPLPGKSEVPWACFLGEFNLKRSLVSIFLLSSRGTRVTCYVTSALFANTELFEAFRDDCMKFNPYVCFEKLHNPITEDFLNSIPEVVVVVEPPSSWPTKGNSVHTIKYYEHWKACGMTADKMISSVTIGMTNDSVDNMLTRHSLGAYSSGAGDDEICHNSTIENGLSVGKSLSVPVLSLLSGGIDSPVASYLSDHVMKLNTHFIHFTSSIDKVGEVQNIVNILSKFKHDESFSPKLYVVGFQKLQNEIALKCAESYRAILYKIFMIKIASHICSENGYLGLITGNALGQVASQTTHNLLQCDLATQLPILSPLLGFSKDAITDISIEIGTYGPSTESGTHDCCVMYVPSAPTTKANAGKIRYETSKIKNYMTYIDIAVL